MIKKINSINYVVCPNGFGHFSRAIVLLKELHKHNINVNLYTIKNQWLKFYPKKLKNVKVVNIKNLPTAIDYKQNKSFDTFFKKLSIKLLKTNLLTICDNYPELILNNKNIILISNFFWHKEIKSIITNDKKILLNKILKQHKFKTFGNKYFAKSYIKKLPNYDSIEFFDKKENILINKSIKTIFVSIGFGNHNINYKYKILNFVKRIKNIDDNFKLIFDNNLKKSKNLFKLDSLSLTKIDLIIGRPSLGILNKSFNYSIPFMPILYKSDKECYHNGKLINKMFGNNKNITKYHKNYHAKLKKLNIKFNAEKVISKYILQKLK